MPVGTLTMPNGSVKTVTFEEYRIGAAEVNYGQLDDGGTVVELRRAPNGRPWVYVGGRYSKKQNFSLFADGESRLKVKGVR